MSPTWAGWAVLYWTLVSATGALIVLLVVVGTRAACRWWSDRSRRVPQKQCITCEQAAWMETVLGDDAWRSVLGTAVSA